MPKINVYLPDALADAVRRAGIPVSSVCQRALADAVAAADEPPGGCSTDLPPPELARFTDRARTVIKTARGMRDRPTSVDVVNGIVAEGNNLAIVVLRALDIDPDDLVAEVRGLAAAPGARADDLTAVIARATEQAVRLAHDYVGCEHLLLGIVAAPAGEVTADALRATGVDEAAARQGVAAALSGFSYGREAALRAGLAAPIRSVLEEIRTRLSHLESR